MKVSRIVMSIAQYFSPHLEAPHIISTAVICHGPILLEPNDVLQEQHVRQPILIHLYQQVAKMQKRRGPRIIPLTMLIRMLHRVSESKRSGQ